MDPQELTKEKIEQVVNRITKHGVLDVRGALDRAVRLLVDDVEPFIEWNDPWKHPTEWLSQEVDPQLRLNCLYKDLIGWAFVKDNDMENLRRMGISPSKARYLDTLRLDHDKVFESIVVLQTGATSRAGCTSARYGSPPSGRNQVVE